MRRLAGWLSSSARLLLAGGMLLATVAAAAAQETAPMPASSAPLADLASGSWTQMVIEGTIRLPLAAVLGAALAFRPKRRGTPTRTPAVVQTQIILTIVGALIMLVVGSSLARAFGIVGAASLIRYRSKIDDPKDAGVMLCGLAVGLASGVGLYGLAVFAALFLVCTVAVIESFEPDDVAQFGLMATGLTDVARSRPRFERVLRGFGARVLAARPVEGGALLRREGAVRARDRAGDQRHPEARPDREDGRDLGREEGQEGVRMEDL